MQVFSGCGDEDRAARHVERAWRCGTVLCDRIAALLGAYMANGGQEVASTRCATAAFRRNIFSDEGRKVGNLVCPQSTVKVEERD